MKIGNITVRISIVALAVVVLFAILLSLAYFNSREIRLLLFGIPGVILLLVIPMAINYMSQKQYQELVPEYEKEARPVRIKMINKSMMGQVVRIEGVVERTYFQFLNRPQFLVGDRSGEISVKMFTSPEETIKKDDVVLVLGTIIQRYIFTGEPVVNCVSIRKIPKKIEIKKDSSKKE
ncbi:MAG: nucleotide-binding protein [Methanomicrobiales archaeon]|nr:nucleotide-binding protein [Methanomicrobiales archaeon]